jgi:SAM-dependent methyltransferase
MRGVKAMRSSVGAKPLALVKRAVKGLLRRPADALLASAPSLRARIDAQVAANPALAARYDPYQERHASYLVPRATTDDAHSADLPVPPRALWVCFEATADEYLGSGRAHVEAMRKILAASGFAFERGRRVLDFGCAAGRMIRWLREEADSCEIWGADIQARHILWCQQHLSPPFHFVTTTTLPHLPFPDGYFDLVYAGSVFSHIADLADAWLLELRRLLAPRGALYVTVHDRRSIELILNFPDDHRLHFLKEQLLAFDRETSFLKHGFARFTLGRTPHGAQVFYDVEHLRKTWGRIFEVRSITPEAYLFQSAVVLEKPRVIRLADARGRLVA